MRHGDDMANTKGIVLGALFLAVGAGVSAWWLRHDVPPGASKATAALGEASIEEPTGLHAEPARPRSSVTQAAAPEAESALAVPPPATGPGAAAVDQAASGDQPPAWPVVEAPRQASRGAPAAAPAVTPEIAFEALKLVGVDASAETTWRRAIDDPAMPADVRSDLIEDLNQEGFVDNSHPTKDDLPLILARLELIERLAPLAKDEVNAAAFEEAYKDLLAMYERLGGAPRGKKK